MVDEFIAQLQETGLCSSFVQECEPLHDTQKSANNSTERFLSGLPVMAYRWDKFMVGVLITILFELIASH